jgi:hypothetical protein
MHISETPRIGRFIRWVFTGFNLKKYETIMNDPYESKSKKNNTILLFFDYFIGISFISFFIFSFVYIISK